MNPELILNMLARYEMQLQAAIAEIENLQKEIQKGKEANFPETDYKG